MYIGKDLAITSYETLTAFDNITGKYLFSLDELQNGNLSQTEESEDIIGKHGRKITTLKRNKAVTMSTSNGLVSGGLLEAQTGGSFTNKEAEVMWADYLTVKDGEAKTSYKAVGTEGAEILDLFILSGEGFVTEELAQAAATSAGKFKYSPSTKTLEFHSDIDDDTEIVVRYKRKIMADVLENHSGNFARKASLYLDLLAEDKCSNVYRVQVYIPKADISGEFSLDFGDGQTFHDFEAEALAGACGGGGNYFTYSVFGENEDDVVAPETT